MTKMASTQSDNVRMCSQSPNRETKTSNEDNVIVQHTTITKDYPLCTAFCDAEAPVCRSMVLIRLSSSDRKPVVFPLPCVAR